jgi:hypothetical protein
MFHAYDLVSSQEQSRSRWVVRLAGYSYAVVGSQGGEIVVFHWHPDGRSPITEPHLHVKGTIAGVDLSKAHVPTGMVSIPSFLRFLIRDLGIEPLRPDWEPILAAPPIEA